MGDKYQIPYTNACIRAFAKRFNLPVKVGLITCMLSRELTFW